MWCQQMTPWKTFSSAHSVTFRKTRKSWTWGSEVFIVLVNWLMYCLLRGQLYSTESSSTKMPQLFTGKVNKKKVTPPNWHPPRTSWMISKTCRVFGETALSLSHASISYSCIHQSVTLISFHYTHHLPAAPCLHFCLYLLLVDAEHSFMIFMDKAISRLVLISWSPTAVYSRIHMFYLLFFHFIFLYRNVKL